MYYDLWHCPQFCVNRKLQYLGFILESCFQIYIIINWLNINAQFQIGWYHFFSISLMARQTDFFNALSFGNDSLFLVYFLIFPFRFSIRLVIQIIFLIPTGKSKNTVSSSQLFLHERIAYGYLAPHFYSKLSNSISTASLVGALQMLLKSAVNSFFSFQTTWRQEFLIWCTTHI